MTRAAMALAAACLAAPAAADQPEAGTLVVITETVLCDALDQIEAIRDAAVVGGWAAVVPIFAALNVQRNEIGDPACAMIAGRALVIPVATVGDPVQVEGRQVWVWAILWQHHEAGEQTGYVLMPVALDEAKPQGTAL